MVLQVFFVMSLYNQTSEPEVKGIVNISQQQAEDNFQLMQKFEQKQIHSIVYKNATLRTEKENLYKNPEQSRNPWNLKFLCWSSTFGIAVDYE